MYMICRLVDRYPVSTRQYGVESRTQGLMHEVPKCNKTQLNDLKLNQSEPNFVGLSFYGIRASGPS